MARGVGSRASDRDVDRPDPWSPASSEPSGKYLGCVAPDSHGVGVEFALRSAYELTVPISKGRRLLERLPAYAPCSINEYIAKRVELSE
jgi:hypothetical protein